MKAAILRFLFVVSVSLFVLASLNGRTRATDTPPLPQKTQAEDENDAALKKLTAEEQSAINTASGNPNDRAKNYVRVTTARLKNVRAFIDQEKFPEAVEEIKIYSAIITHAGKYFATVKSRDKSHKTIELGLKEHLRQLESLRRDITFDYADPVEAAMKTTNRVRLQAINALVGDGAILSTTPDKKDPNK